MIHSMTGFGKHAIQLPSKKITVELKSLNSKNLDLNARLPQNYREHELRFRKQISDVLLRGKVDFILSVEFTGNESSAEINKQVVAKYMEELRQIAAGDDLKLLEMALRMPDTLSTDKDEVDAEELKGIQQALDKALENLC